VEIPAYWLPRPDVRLDPGTAACFDRLLGEALDRGPERAIDYQLSAPKWQFLCHAADRGAVVLHGSGDPHLTQMQPRQPDDVLDFSNRHAVFAATDGIWPIFYAVLDRSRHPAVHTCNACVRVGGATRYFFSISRQVLEQRPWRTGTVYLLPAETFEAQPPIEVGDGRIHVAQSASAVPVEPLAKLSVQPDDFPHLQQVHGHDDEVLSARMAANPDGFPWFEDGDS
jgi:hypothetical protein